MLRDLAPDPNAHPGNHEAHILASQRDNVPAGNTTGSGAAAGGYPYAGTAAGGYGLMGGDFGGVHQDDMDDDVGTGTGGGIGGGMGGAGGMSASAGGAGPTV